jgi:hypothetical protein
MNAQFSFDYTTCHRASHAAIRIALQEIVSIASL